MAQEDLKEPVTVDVIEAIPIKKEVGKAFKTQAKDIMEGLAKLTPEQVTALEAQFSQSGYAGLLALSSMSLVVGHLCIVFFLALCVNAASAPKFGNRKYRAKIKVESVCMTMVLPFWRHCLSGRHGAA